MRSTLFVLYILCANIFVSSSFGSVLLFSGDTTDVITQPLDQISFQPEVFLTPLAGDVDENSGLILWQGKIWTHNDSGGEPEIYCIDTATGKILQTIRLLNAENNDWEDITQDEDYIYVGDVGNNRGNRKNLRIYKLAKSLIPIQWDAEISSWEQINFQYADQKVFEKRMNSHDFDCESITVIADSIYLFTKNWADQQTRVYALSTEPGDHVVYPKNTFDAGGLITASSLSPDKKQLALLGYIDFESFMWIFWDFEGTDFFGGSKLRVNFPDLVFVQTEGICFLNDTDVLISCEESSEPPMLFSVNTDSLKMLATERLGDFFSNDIVLSGMPPEVSNRLKVDILQIPEPEFSFELRNKRWNKLFEGNDVKRNAQKKMRILIRTKDLDSGLYFLKVTSGEHSIIRKVRVKH